MVKSVLRLERLTAIGLLIGLLTTQPSFSAESDQDDLDEVVVQGSRALLDNMREELRQLEERFYLRYNELNTIEEFDVHCRFEARTGTRLPRHSCTAVFEDDAKREEGVDALGVIQYMRGYGTTGLLKSSPPPPPTIKIEARRSAFQKNMKAVVGSDRELIVLLQKRAELIRRYEAVRLDIFGLESSPAP